MVEKSLSSFDEVVYSTNPEFEYEYARIKEPETLPPGKQKLSISIDTRKMDGALVTKIVGFVGKRIDLISIGQDLQQACRTEGSAQNYDIVLFRDVRKRAYVYLRNQGYKVQFADF